MTTTSDSIYIDLRGHWAFLHDSYQGGPFYTRPSSVVADQRLTVYVSSSEDPNTVVPSFAGMRRSYLVPFPGETPEAFDMRLKLANYINFPQTIVDSYADAITPGVTRDLGALDARLSNLDGQGKTWAGLVDEVTHWTAAYGWFATVLDAPRANPAVNALEEEAGGFSLRVISVHPTAVAWITLGDDGAVEEFAYRETSGATTSYTCKVKVWCWTRTEWMLLEGEVITRDPIEGQRKRLEPIERGKHGTPGVVPVAFSYFKRNTATPLPLGASPIDDAAKVAQVVYNGLSRIESYHRRATPFLAIPQAEARGALPPETAIQVGPDEAFGFSATSGTPQWVSPPSEMPGEIRAHCVFLMAASFRVAGLEVTADSSAQVQSGEALRVRSRGFESKAKQFAGSMNAWELRMLDLVQRWLRMRVAVTVTYPERYVLPDRAEDLAQAVVFFDKFGDKLGAQGTIAVLRQALTSAVTLSDDDVAAVLDEAFTKLGGASAGTSEIYAYDYEAGIVEVNAALARKGLPPIDAAAGMSTLVWKAIQEAKAAALIRSMGLEPAPAGGTGGAP